MSLLTKARPPAVRHHSRWQLQPAVRQVTSVHSDSPWRIRRAASPQLHTRTPCASAKKLGRGFAAAASDNMLLLQSLVDLSQGKYYASSVKDARQLARVASVVKELFFLSHLWTHDSDHVTCDKAAVDIRSAVKECLDQASKLTYEDREKFIVQMDRHVKVMQSGQDVLEAGRSVVDLEREIDAKLEKVRAEAARAKAELQEAEAKAAHYDKCYRDYMESGDDYGERDRNYRKRALEGDADAAFFFARQDALLAGEVDARFEAIEMDMSLFE